MDDIMKSSSAEAENESNGIVGKEGEIQELAGLVIERTNLPVVENLQSIHNRMNACNESYKNLLKNHADNIRKLGQEFSDLDSALAETMSVVR